MKTVVIIQARMGSNRLPGKVLMDIAGRPMVAHVHDRVARAEKIDRVVVATTVEEIDTPLAGFCSSQGWCCFRGSHEDVLDRYYQAACKYQADVVVRVTADCPLIDPGVIDQVVGEFQSQQPTVDYASNTLEPRTFPRGLDVEVFKFASLERAWREATDSACREHVTPYFYRSPDVFQLLAVRAKTVESAQRWTVDTPEDLQLIRSLFEHLAAEMSGWQSVLAMVQQRPELAAINAHIQQKVA